MDDFNLIESLGQVSSSEAGVIFRNFLRGDTFTMTANGKESAVYQIILKFDSESSFPVARTEYYDESKSSGATYVASKFETIGEIKFPTSLQLTSFSGDQKGEMTIETTFDRAKALDTDQCNLEAYNIKKPKFELANQRKSYLPTIFVSALVLIVTSGVLPQSKVEDVCLESRHPV